MKFALVAAGAFVVALVVPANVRAAPPESSPSIAKPVAGCDDIVIGPVYDASLTPGKKLECYQFTTEGTDVPTKLNALVAGLAGDAPRDTHLDRVLPDGTTAVADTIAGSDAFRSLYALSGKPERWLLMVGTDDAPEVGTHQLQVTTSPTGDRYEPNDSLRLATSLHGNQRFNATIDSPDDVDYVTWTFPANEAAPRFRFDAPAGLTLERWDGANWNPLAQGQLVLPAPTSLGSTAALRITAGPGNFTRTIGYSLRASGSVLKAIVSRYGSSERITHLAPGLIGGTTPGGANAARLLDVTVTVFDAEGKTPASAGERVVIHAFDSDGTKSSDVLLAKTVGYTDARGEVSVQLSIGSCRGVGVIGPTRLHRGSNRPEYWDLTYVPTAYVEAMVDGRTGGSEKKQLFQHVCREIYRGSRP